MYRFTTIATPFTETVDFAGCLPLLNNQCPVWTTVHVGAAAGDAANSVLFTSSFHDCSTVDGSTPGERWAGSRVPCLPEFSESHIIPSFLLWDKIFWVYKLWRTGYALRMQRGLAGMGASEPRGLH